MNMDKIDKLINYFDVHRNTDLIELLNQKGQRKKYKIGLIAPAICYLSLTHLDEFVLVYFIENNREIDTLIEALAMALDVPIKDIYEVVSFSRWLCRPDIELMPCYIVAMALKYFQWGTGQTGANAYHEYYVGYS